MSASGDKWDTFENKKSYFFQLIMYDNFAEGKLFKAIAGG